MDGVLTIGPLALSTGRLAGVGSIWLFVAASGWIAGRSSGKGATAGWIAAGGGMLAARFAYVARNLEAFRLEPMSAVYIWQGGFEPVFGVAAAALLLALLLRNRERWMSLAVLAIVAAGWLGFSAMSRLEPLRPMPPLASVTDIRGVPVERAGIKGPMVINLWATWCPPCRREMPRLQETAAASPDVPFILLNQREQPWHVQRYLREEGIDPRRVLLDPAGGLAARLGATALPTTVFVNSDGKIVRVHSGEISRAALLSGMREIRRRGK